MSLLPAALAVLAAILFGLTVHFQHFGLDDTDGLTGTLFAVGAMAVVFWLLSPLYMQWSMWTTRAALLFGICGLVFPAIASRLQILAVGVVGPSLSASVGSFAPLFAVFPAVVFLDEPFGPWQAAGLALMIGGLVMSAGVHRGAGARWGMTALLIPLGAAAFRGIVQPIARAGLIELPNPAFASLVMGTVSTVVLGVMVLASPQRSTALRITPGRGWFALSGLAIGAGILALNGAIGLGGVVIAAPLVTTTPLWALLYGAFIFRREKLHLRHAIVAALVVIGAVMVVSGGGRDLAVEESAIVAAHGER